MIIYNKLLPFNGYKAVNICGIIFARHALNAVDINHEEIHTAQMKELLYIGFYIWYFIEWFIRLFLKGDAYKNICFEKEAFENQHNLEYLKTRKHYNEIVS